MQPITQKPQLAATQLEKEVDNELDRQMVGGEAARMRWGYLALPKGQQRPPGEFLDQAEKLLRKAQDFLGDRHLAPIIMSPALRGALVESIASDIQAGQTDLGQRSRNLLAIGKGAEEAPLLPSEDSEGHSPERSDPSSLLSVEDELVRRWDEPELCLSDGNGPEDIAFNHLATIENWASASEAIRWRAAGELVRYREGGMADQELALLELERLQAFVDEVNSVDMDLQGDAEFEGDVDNEPLPTECASDVSIGTTDLMVDSKLLQGEQGTQALWSLSTLAAMGGTVLDSDGREVFGGSYDRPKQFLRIGEELASLINAAPPEQRPLLALVATAAEFARVAEMCAAQSSLSQHLLQPERELAFLLSRETVREIIVLHGGYTGGNMLNIGGLGRSIAGFLASEATEHGPFPEPVLRMMRWLQSPAFYGIRLTVDQALALSKCAEKNEHTQWPSIESSFLALVHGVKGVEEHQLRLTILRGLRPCGELADMHALRAKAGQARGDAAVLVKQTCDALEKDIRKLEQLGAEKQKLAKAWLKNKSSIREAFPKIPDAAAGHIEAHREKILAELKDAYSHEIAELRGAIGEIRQIIRGTELVTDSPKDEGGPTAPVESAKPRRRAFRERSDTKESAPFTGTQTSTSTETSTDTSPGWEKLTTEQEKSRKARNHEQNEMLRRSGGTLGKPKRRPDLPFSSSSSSSSSSSASTQSMQTTTATFPDESIDKYNELIAWFQADGWKAEPKGGSHLTFHKPGNEAFTIVPQGRSVSEPDRVRLKKFKKRFPKG